MPLGIKNALHTIAHRQLQACGSNDEICCEAKRLSFVTCILFMDSTYVKVHARAIVAHKWQ